MSEFSKRRRLKPEEKAKHHITQLIDQDGLNEKFINDFIGRGVFASKAFDQGDFLLQYCGIVHTDVTDLEDTNFTYHFRFKGKNYCIDATEEPKDGPVLGRLVNHADFPKERNSTMKIIEIGGSPYLCLFSTRYIEEGEEIRYDYGVKDLPWQNKNATDNSKTKDLETTITDNPNCTEDLGTTITETQNCTEDLGSTITQKPNRTQDLGTTITETPNCTEDLGTTIIEKQNCTEDLKSTEDLGNTITGEPNCKEDLGTTITETQNCTKDIGNTITETPNCTEDLGTTITETQNRTKDIGNTITETPNCTEDLGTTITEKPNCTKDIGTTITETPNCTEDLGTTITEEMNCTEDVESTIAEKPNCTEDLGTTITEEMNCTEDVESTIAEKPDYIEDLRITITEKLNSTETCTVNKGKDNSNTEINIPDSANVIYAGQQNKDEFNFPETSKTEGGDSMHTNFGDSVRRNTDSLVLGTKYINHEDKLNDLEVNTLNKQNYKETELPENIQKYETDRHIADCGNEHIKKNTEDIDMVVNISEINDNKHPIESSEVVIISERNWRNSCPDNSEAALKKETRNRKRKREKKNQKYEDVSITDLQNDGISDNNSEGDAEDFDDDLHDPDFTINGQYVSESEYSGDSDYSDIVPVIPKNKVKKSVLKCIESLEKQTTEKDSIPRANEEKELSLSQSEDTCVKNNKIFLPSTTAYVDGKRVADKQHACVFCKRLDTRISRHLRNVHKKEEAMKKLTDLSEKETSKELDRLRLLGDYNHNIEVLKRNEGLFIVPRRPSTVDEGKYTYEDFLPCIHCKGFFLKNEMWRHQLTCKFKQESNDGTTKRPQSSSILFLQASVENRSENQQFMDRVLSTFIVDDISTIARNDPLIIHHGETLFLKHGVSQKQYISQEMRLLARLTKTLREISSIKDGTLKDFLVPSLFDTIVEAAQSLSGKEEISDRCVFNTPSVALKCGPLLKKCCIILRGQALRAGDESKEKDADRLQALIEQEWKQKVTSIALRSVKESKRNKQILLPTTEDLIELKEYLEKEMKERTEILQRSPSMENYQKASASVLARIIMFNRRRSGETSKILLTDFTERPQWGKNLNKEILSSLKPIEKELINRLDMIEIRGKRGRTVPVILMPDVKKTLDLLVSCRSNVGISEENEYLFPRASGKNFIRGHVCIKKFCKKAELEFPERIGSTSMRKYIATVTQVLNLKEGEVEWLSNHLGHSVNVHREFYRNQEAALELGTIAKMLIAVDSGRTLVKENVQISDLPDDSELLDSDSDEDDEEVEDHEEIGYSSVNNSRLDLNAEEENKQIHKRKTNSNLGHSKEKKRWSEEEFCAVKRSLQGFINVMKVPGKADCEAAKAAEACLKDRDWRAIKFFVYNQIIKKKKK